MGGGFASHGNSVIRNNKRERVDKLGRIAPYSNQKNKPKPEYVTISKNELESLREKLENEQRLLSKKRRIVFIITFIFIIGLLSFLLFI